MAQWEYKRAFAVEADRGSRALLDEAIGRARPAPATPIAIVNTLARRRGGLVVLPADRSHAGDRVAVEGGHAVPSQRLADGGLAVAVADVPALGSASLRVGSGHASPPKSPATASGTVLENAALRVELDPTTGAIRSLVDRVRGVELAGPQGLARYRYVLGRDPAAAQDAGSPTITVEEPGPLVAVLRAEGPAPGARRAVTRYRLVAGSDRLEVELVLDKLPVRAKESAHLTFDFAVEGGGLRIDQGWNLMDPAKDALPGSCREFVGVHSVLDAAGPKGGIALGVLDSPLVELGTMVDERPSAIGIRQWRQEPYAGTTVHAFLLNNYWHTNYKAEQQGLLRFRFVAPAARRRAAGDPHGPQPRPRAAAPRPAGGLSGARLRLRARGRPRRAGRRASAVGRGARPARAAAQRERPPAGRSRRSQRPGVPRAVGGQDRPSRLTASTPPSARAEGRPE